MLGTPKKLTIRFPLPDPEESLKTSLELWGGNGVLKCWCADTETAHRLTKDGQVIETPCTHPDCGQFKAGNCTAVGRLKFEIPELGLGLFQLDTKSWNTISSLAGALSLYNPIPKDQFFELSMVKKKNAKGTFNVLVLTPVGSTVTAPIVGVETPEAPEDE